MKYRRNIWHIFPTNLSFLEKPKHINEHERKDKNMRNLFSKKLIVDCSPLYTQQMTTYVTNIIKTDPPQHALCIKKRYREHEKSKGQQYTCAINPLIIRWKFDPL